MVAENRRRESTAAQAAQPNKKQPTRAQASAQKPAKLPRYIAVDTEKSDKTSPQAKKSVMVWDTEKQEVASGAVYDVKKSPTVGETAKFDRYSAEYVGSGS